MACKVTLDYKIRECQLFQHRRMNIDETPHLQERFDQRQRQDQIAETQRWKEHFAESANVNHAFRVIKPLQSSQWTLGKSIFAVVVIFENVGACALRPMETDARA